jgi:hypothetical protein
MEGHTIQGIVFAAQSPATRATVLRNTHMQTGECDAKDGEIIVLSSRLQLHSPTHRRAQGFVLPSLFVSLALFRLSSFRGLPPPTSNNGHTTAVFRTEKKYGHRT